MSPSLVRGRHRGRPPARRAAGCAPCPLPERSGSSRGGRCSGRRRGRPGPTPDRRSGGSVRPGCFPTGCRRVACNASTEGSSGRAPRAVPTSEAQAPRDGRRPARADRGRRSGRRRRRARTSRSPHRRSRAPRGGSTAPLAASRAARDDRAVCIRADTSRRAGPARPISGTPSACSPRTGAEPRLGAGARSGPRGVAHRRCSCGGGTG